MSLCVICGGRHFESECPLPDWTPVNPCQPDCKQRDCYCPPNNRFGCPEYRDYQGAVEGQRKLLEYLKATADLRTREKWLSTFEAMLKELETK